MYKIVEKKILNPAVIQLLIEAPLVANKAKPGQFIILRVDEEGERIPLTVAGVNKEKGIVKIIFPAPEQNLPLSCSLDHLDLRVGESCRLGDYLDGVENFALLICRVSEEGVVAISPGEGFLVSAAAEGETVIRISKGEQSVEVSVNVYA